MTRFADALLGWYDREARALPWRVPPAERAQGVRPDPYRVWLSEIMLQQTTVATVGPYFARFVARWPTVEALAASSLDAVLTAWAGLGYYARARNLHRCAQTVVAQHGGRFPETEAALRELPGIGPYTAAAIAAIAFDRRAVVVDGNVERVMARLFRVETPLPDAKDALRRRAADLTPHERPGDYAQAVMDLGATVCAPRRPLCGACPVASACEARAEGDPARFPIKRPKTPKPIRYGCAYLLLDPSGRVLLRRRPEAGLLGGMLGLPGSDWTEEPPSAAVAAAAAPAAARWIDLAAEVRHTFTHFHLRVGLLGARLSRRPRAVLGEWVSPDRLDDRAVPTLTRKAVALGLSGMEGSR